MTVSPFYLHWKLLLPIDVAVLGHEKTPSLPPDLSLKTRVSPSVSFNLVRKKKKEHTTHTVFKYMEGRRLGARNGGRAVWLGRL